MPRRWRGVIAQEGLETGDHRMFEPGAIYWRSLPRDFGVIFEDGSWGHENAVTVGTVEVIERQGENIYAEGTLFDNDANADRYANMLAQGGGRNVSVDVCAGTARYEIVGEDGEVLPEDTPIDILFDPSFEGYMREVWSEAEVCSLVAARTCAFADALIELVAESEAEAEPAGLRLRGGSVYANGTTPFVTIADLPVGEEVRWVPDDGDEATATVTSVDEEAGTVTLEVNGEPVEAEAEEEPEDEATAGTQARAQPVAERYPRLAAALVRERGGSRVVTASGRVPGRPGAVLRASVAWEGGYPAEMFERLAMSGPTPFTVTDEGEIFGHIALFGQCHSGFLAGAFGECISPPRSPSEYRTFYANRQVRCADGSRLRVGVLTMDTSHASAGSAGNRPDLSAVVRHYEDTGLVAGYLRAYDDEYGVQVHGAVREGLTVDDVRRLMATAPSGDWRDYGEGLDLAGILMVNQPGYPVVEREEGRQYALVASLSPRQAEVVAPHSCGCGGSCCATQQATATATPARRPAPPAEPTQDGHRTRYALLRRRAELDALDRRVGRRQAGLTTAPRGPIAYSSSGRPVETLAPPPSGPAPGAR